MTSKDKKCFISAVSAVLILAAFLTVRQTNRIGAISIEPEPRVCSTAAETVESTNFSAWPVPLDINLQWYIDGKCGAKGIKPELVLALIWRESRYRNDVIGSQGELGLMQVHPCNAEEVANVLNVNDLTDPWQNIKAGIYILGKALETADGDLNKALMVYNLGDTGAKEQWQKGVYSTPFSRSVLEKMAELEGTQ